MEDKDNNGMQHLKIFLTLKFDLATLEGLERPSAEENNSQDIIGQWECHKFSCQDQYVNDAVIADF